MAYTIASGQAEIKKRMDALRLQQMREMKITSQVCLFLVAARSRNK